MELETKKKILVVEDEEEWRSQVSASLTEAGYEVLPARNGSEAMDQAQAHCFGLMMVGDDLEGESGRMLAKFLHYNHPEVPIVLCTNRPYEEGEMLDLMDEGIERCLPKGCPEELIVTVGCCIR